MYENFTTVIEAAKSSRKKTIAVANAADEEVIKTLKTADSLNIARSILVGKKSEIEEIAKKYDYQIFEMMDSHSPEESVEIAVKLVREKKADVLMKGLVNTSPFMRGVLDKDKGLRTGRLLSLLAVYELPFYHKLLFCSDSGINVAPDIEQKKDILENMLQAMSRMGLSKPKVAALAANEVLNPKITASQDAADLVAAVNENELSACTIEGPISFDLAFDADLAKHKQYESAIAGDVDALLFPNIESGNLLGKTWLLFNKAKWAGIVLGATNPVILGSRSDNAEVKINSLALACID